MAGDDNGCSNTNNMLETSPPEVAPNLASNDRVQDSIIHLFLGSQFMKYA
eukprot:CAMPEP_0198154852 /NCGR_PEP_ID=MMETSP1443-20131203/68827_1 /TAXON_ID=186043 /ORGANISM="Entomoneis sp., Strain CCMP2396" /LENGTH=49 /DNA_ID=CAMNT_0043821569 /DNA_START=227 /DNA_END=376 /DNA_ORIENTATION=-